MSLQTKKRLKLNRKGFSLAELMVAMAIGVVVVGGAAFAFIETSNTFQRLSNQYETESEMMRMMYVLKASFAQTNSIFYKGAIPCNGQTRRGASETHVTSKGILCSGNLNNTTDGNVNLVAFGLREMGGYQATVAGSKSAFQAYGVFYQNPSPTRSGALYIDLEDHPGDWVKLSPINAPFTFTRFTEFEVRNVRYLNNNLGLADAGPAMGLNNVIQSVEVRAVMRYFNGGSQNTMRWCPAAMIAGTPACQSRARYFDIERVMKMNFTNNQINPATSDTGPFNRPRRTFGNLYFFRGFAPTVRR